MTQTYKGLWQCAKAQIFTPYYKLYDKMKIASIFQKTFDRFMQINNPLI